VAITCCLNLRCSPNACITFVKKKFITSNTLLLRETLSPFGAPSTDLVYPKSIVNNGSSAKSSLPRNTARPGEKAPAGRATIDPARCVSMILDQICSTLLCSGDRKSLSLILACLPRREKQEEKSCRECKCQRSPAWVCKSSFLLQL
jgi:hypothetical protein